MGVLDPMGGFPIQLEHVFLLETSNWLQQYYHKNQTKLLPFGNQTYQAWHLEIHSKLGFNIAMFDYPTANEHEFSPFSPPYTR